MTKQELDKKIESAKLDYCGDRASESICDCEAFKAGSKFGGQEYAKYILEMLMKEEWIDNYQAIRLHNRLKEDGLL